MVASNTRKVPRHRGAPAAAPCVLLLGAAHDPVCTAVGEALTRRGAAWRLIATFAELGLALHIDQDAPRVALRLQDGTILSANELRGLLLRTVCGIDPAGWDADDLAYVSAEARSALIALVWSLRCPVVNRSRPELWHRGQTSAFAWRHELRRAGLAIPPQTVRCGADVDVRRGQPAQARLSLATSPTQYEVRDDADWEHVARLAAVLPVTLTARRRSPASACVACGAVIWACEPPAALRACEAALARLAAATGLDLFEVTLVEADEGACVEAVRPWAALAGFDEAARRQIGERLADALTRSARETPPAYEELRP